MVPSNISNGSVMSGLSTYTSASSVQFFALTNFDVRFHFNLATFFFKFFNWASSISNTSLSTWTVASAVKI